MTTLKVAFSSGLVRTTHCVRMPAVLDYATGYSERDTLYVGFDELDKVSFPRDVVGRALSEPVIAT